MSMEDELADRVSEVIAKRDSIWDPEEQEQVAQLVNDAVLAMAVAITDANPMVRGQTYALEDQGWTPDMKYDFLYGIYRRFVIEGMVGQREMLGIVKDVSARWKLVPIGST